MQTCNEKLPFDDIQFWLNDQQCTNIVMPDSMLHFPQQQQQQQQPQLMLQDYYYPVNMDDFDYIYSPSLTDATLTTTNTGFSTPSATCNNSYLSTCSTPSNSSSYNESNEFPLLSLNSPLLYQVMLDPIEFTSQPSCEPTIKKEQCIITIRKKSSPGEKPFACHICPRQFARKHDLQRHIRVHTGAKPYSCLHCAKSFARTDALKRHLMMEERCRKSPVIQAMKEKGVRRYRNL